MRTPFTFFLFICCFHLTFEAMRSTVDLYVKGVKFTFNEKYQSNLKFVLKASRSKPTGLIQFSVFQLSPIINILIDIHLFYRYGTIYRNYLIIKEGVELCELYKDMKDRKPRYQNALAELFRLGTSLCSKQLSKGCPYPAGWYNLTNVDINGTISPLLPSIVPAGLLL